MTTTKTTGPDFDVTFDGSSLWLITPLNDAARDHLDDHTDREAQWFGNALVVEHRYIGSFIEQLTESKQFRVRVN